MITHNWTDENGIAFRADLQQDDTWPELDWLGQLEETWQPGAVAHLHHDGRRIIGPMWFIPTNDIEDVAAFYQNEQGKTRITAIRIAGKQVLQDYEHWRNYGKTWSNYGLTVSATFKGIDIGTDAIWGLDLNFEDVDFDNEHIAGWEKELVACIMPRIHDTAQDAQRNANLLADLAAQLAELEKLTQQEHDDIETHLGDDA